MVKKLIKSSIQTLRALKESGVTDNLTKFPVNRFEIKESKRRAKTPKSLDNIEVMNVKTEKQLSKITTIEELKTYIKNLKDALCIKRPQMQFFQTAIKILKSC